MNAKIRYGMIGGGPEAMIGSIHRHAAALDGCYELVCGVFSRDIDRSNIFGTSLGLAETRLYPDHKTLFACEKQLPVSTRMEVVVIATPNDSHFEIAKQALLMGFHIIIDKPLTQFVSQANTLQRLHQAYQQLVCVTYTYSGYSMIKEIAQLVANKKLGHLKKIVIEFTQGWLASPIEQSNNKQARWRMDPTRSNAGTVADIGTHAFQLAEYLTQRQVLSVFANLQTHITGRLLEDDAIILLNFSDALQGVLLVSQALAGETGNIKVRLHGDKASVHWSQEQADQLLIKPIDAPAQLLQAGYDNVHLHSETRKHCRLPMGHPQGFIEAFANHYRNFAIAMQDRKTGKMQETYDYPTLRDGVRGVYFVEAALASHASQAWQNIKSLSLENA